MLPKTTDNKSMRRAYPTRLRSDYDSAEIGLYSPLSGHPRTLGRWSSCRGFARMFITHFPFAWSSFPETLRGVGSACVVWWRRNTDLTNRLPQVLIYRLAEDKWNKITELHWPWYACKSSHYNFDSFLSVCFNVYIGVGMNKVHMDWIMNWSYGYSICINNIGSLLKD